MMIPKTNGVKVQHMRIATQMMISLAQKMKKIIVQPKRLQKNPVSLDFIELVSLSCGKEMVYLDEKVCKMDKMTLAISQIMRYTLSIETGLAGGAAYTKEALEWQSLSRMYPRSVDCPFPQ